MRDGALDLGVAPGAEPLLAVRGDVARNRALPALGQAPDERRHEWPRAGAERGLVLHLALVERRVAFEAMADRRQVRATAHLVLHVALAEAAVGERERLVRDRRAVDRCGDHVLHRRQRAQVDDDRVEIARHERLEEVCGHHGQGLARERAARRPLAVRDRALDLGIGPRADAGVAVGGDVRRDDREWRDVDGDASSGELLAGDGPPLCVLGGVAVAARHDRRHEVAAALERCGLRVRRRQCECEAGERDRRDAKRGDQDRNSVHGNLRARILAHSLHAATESMRILLVSDLHYTLAPARLGRARRAVVRSRRPRRRPARHQLDRLARCPVGRDPALPRAAPGGRHGRHRLGQPRPHRPRRARRAGGAVARRGARRRRSRPTAIRCCSATR